MIRRLKVSNFRSLDRDVQVEPGRIAFFVGPNGAGKSNLLDVLSFVREAVTVGLPAAVTSRNGIGAVRRHSRGHPHPVRVGLELDLDGRPAAYGFVIVGDSRSEYRVGQEQAEVTTEQGERVVFERRGDTWRAPQGLHPRVDDQSLALTALGGVEPFRSLHEALSRMVVYAVFPNNLEVPQRFDTARPMRRHGENWVSALKDLLRDPDAREQLVTALGKVAGDIEDVRVTPAGGHLVAEFKQAGASDREKRWFDAGQQSDGTLRVAGLLTALLQRPPLPVVGIEEPELTVHPGVLPVIWDFFLQAAEVSQILVTTHSPALLDAIDVERVRLFSVERRGGRTAVRRVGGEHLDPIKKGLYRAGDLLLSGDLQLPLFQDFDEPEGG